MFYHNHTMPLVFRCVKGFGCQDLVGALIYLLTFFRSFCNLQALVPRHGKQDIKRAGYPISQLRPLINLFQRTFKPTTLQLASPGSAPALKARRLRLWSPFWKSSRAGCDWQRIFRGQVFCLGLTWFYPVLPEFLVLLKVIFSVLTWYRRPFIGIVSHFLDAY